MEYTKDIAIRHKREIGVTKFKNWTSNVKKEVKENKVIAITLTLLSTLMIIDIVLIHSFLNILTNFY